MTKLKLLFASRKFWAAVVGLALVLIQSFYPDFPLEAEELTTVIYVLVAYILGTGIEDGLSRTTISKKT